MAASNRSAKQGKGPSKRAGGRRSLSRNPGVLRRAHAAMHQFADRLEQELDAALRAARARQLGGLRRVLQVCRYLRRYVGEAPDRAAEPAVQRPTGIKVKPDLLTGLKQVDTEAFATCINGLAEAVDALAPLEGRPFARKPIAVIQAEPRHADPDRALLPWILQPASEPSDRVTQHRSAGRDVEVKAGERIVLYSTSHSYGTEVAGRVSDIELAELMGRTDTRTTRRYMHLNADRLRSIQRRAQG